MTSLSTVVTLTGTYTFDHAHSRIGLDARELAKSRVEVTIKAASIDTERDASDANGRANTVPPRKSRFF